MNNILEVIDLVKDYPLPNGRLRVFDGLDFSLGRGELVAIMGASGVGKTTLLNLLGLLDSPTGGRIMLDGEDVFAGNETGKARLRNRKIGFIYQFYHLLPEFTALENVAFPLMIRGTGRHEAEAGALAMLNEVGLTDKARLRPGKLSGGEQQRIAVARALVNDPALLLADEPTGNLDWKTGRRILELIRDLHLRKGLSSIVVTHNEKVAAFCDRTVVMEAGTLRVLPLSA